MKIRKLNEGDLLDLFNWRNDKFTRKMFTKGNVIDFSEHEKWFIKSKNNPNIEFYIGVEGNKKLGVVRFEFDKLTESSELSININPLMRGKGYGKDLLKKSIRQYINNNKNLLKAKIKNENDISTRLFVSLGFSQYKKNSKYTYFEYNPNEN